jgi:hypothetical protein
MHNRIKQDQLFVIVPEEFFDDLPVFFKEIKIDVNASRKITKPPHSKFRKKEKAGKGEEEASSMEEGQADTSSLTFTMDWDDAAKELMKKVPEGIIETAVTNAEEFAREKGYKKVTEKSIRELMDSMGMNLDDLM